MGAKKGLNDFIELSKQLDSHCRIVLVGLTTKQIQQLPKSIIGITRTENIQTLAEIYSTSDVFINPTYEDTFPTTNLEALSCGTPVITYKTGGSPEAIDDLTGIVVERGNIKQLIKAIEQVRKNGKEHYTDACRNRAIQYYNKDDRFEDYISLYNEILYKTK